MSANDTKIEKQLRRMIHADCRQRPNQSQFGTIDTAEKALRARYVLVDEALSSPQQYPALGMVWLNSLDAIQTGLRSGDLRLAAILAQPVAFFVGLISASQCEFTQRAFPLMQDQLRAVFLQMLPFKPNDDRQLEVIAECAFDFLRQLIPFPPTATLASELLSELSTQSSNLSSICIRGMVGLQFFQDKAILRDLNNRLGDDLNTKLVSQISELMKKDFYVNYFLEREANDNTFLVGALSACIDQLP